MITGPALVAVVDDDFRVLESLESLLEAAGYAVRGFASGPALLASTALHEANLVITDVGMPHMDGFALRRRLREERPTMPIVLITGRPDLLERAGMLEDGGAPIFSKPFDVEQLLQTVARHLQEAG